jgi:microcystin-dependent protein
MVFRDKARDGTTRLTGGGIDMAAVLLAAHPVGSYYTSDDPTDPHDLFGGTWARVKGVVVVGLDEAQTEFDTAGETGGEKAHLLTEQESGLRNHAHTASSGANNASHTHGLSLQWANTTTTTSNGYRVTDIDNKTGGGGTGATAQTGGQSANHLHAITVNASGAFNANSAHNNLQPYVVAYMWKRTA